MFILASDERWQQIAAPVEMTQMKVAVAPSVLRWACERSGLEQAALVRRFPKLEQWLSGKAAPTLKQLEAFARATYTPIGFFFLAAPPEEQPPIPDFRAPYNPFRQRPSANLLDTIYLCQQRQEWYREFALVTAEPARSFVGSAQLDGDVGKVAAHIRETLHFSVAERRRLSSWTEALRLFIDQADAAGILVMINGVVGNNAHRKLNPAEFRGFALADPVAPLIFINGADTKAGQMFTLAHELAHIWLGETALSDADITGETPHRVEQWCNAVAAELLAPLDELWRSLWLLEFERVPLHEAVDRLARDFKVSRLVILRRLYDAGAISYLQFRDAYEQELRRLSELTQRSGGHFYATTTARAGKRFTRAILTAVWEGRASFTEACRLLGIKQHTTLERLSRELEIIPNGLPA